MTQSGFSIYTSVPRGYAGRQNGQAPALMAFNYRLRHKMTTLSLPRPPCTATSTPGDPWLVGRWQMHAMIGGGRNAGCNLQSGNVGDWEVCLSCLCRDSLDTVFLLFSFNPPHDSMHFPPTLIITLEEWQHVMTSFPLSSLFDFLWSEVSSLMSQWQFDAGHNSSHGKVSSLPDVQ